MPWQKAKGNTRYLEAVFCFGEPALTKGIFFDRKPGQKAKGNSRC